MIRRDEGTGDAMIVTSSGDALKRCRLLLQDGLDQALAASLYESPADTLYSATAVVLELVNYHLATAAIERVAFDAVVIDKRGDAACRWSAGERDSRPKGRSRAYAAVAREEVPPQWEKQGNCNEFVGTRQLLDRQALRVRVGIPEGSHANERISGIARLAEEIVVAWLHLAERHGSRFYLSLQNQWGASRTVEEGAGFRRDLSRTFNSRLREVLQRLEEQLPREVRVSYDHQGEPVPSQLYFMRRASTRCGETTAPRAGKMDRLAYLMLHEDLRLLERWVHDGTILSRLQAAAEKLGWASGPQRRAAGGDCQAAARFLERVAQDEGQSCVAFLRQAYEQTLHQTLDEDRLSLMPAERAMQTGTPVITWGQGRDALFYEDRQAEADIQIALIEETLWQAQPASDAAEGRNVLFWPVKVMGRPFVLLHLSFPGGDPLVCDYNLFERFRSTVQSLFDLGGSAWHILFDLYCELFIDSFTERYLSHVRARKEVDQAERKCFDLERLARELNDITDCLGELFGSIYPGRWMVEGKDHGDVLGKSLWQLQMKFVAAEEDRSITGLAPGEEMRLMRLEEEKPWLGQLVLRPPVGASHDRPEMSLMYEHLCWRLGHATRYKLPLVLMTLDHQMAFAMRRQKEILRHELGGLTAGCRELVLQMDCNHGTIREDLRLMLRLVQRTLGVTGDGGERVTIHPPDRPIDVVHLFDIIQRNFASKFRFTTEGGYEGVCRIVDLGVSSLRVWISEEDFYALWRNLWNNARQILADYSRETPTDGARREPHKAILRECGAFTERFHPADPPTPMLLGILYDRREEEGRRWFYMDILDNAPRLKAGPMRYPKRAKAGHYGLAVVADVIDQLKAQGYAAEFEPVSVLTEEVAQSYESFPALNDYDWSDASGWTRTSVRLQAEWG